MMLKPTVHKTFVVKDDLRQPEVHCSTVQAAGAYVYAAWFGGAKEGADDVKIWFSRSTDHGTTFSPPLAIAARPSLVHWNPVLFLPSPHSDPTRLFLYYKTGTPIPAWRTQVIHSTDGGQTWSEPRELVPGPGGDGGRGPSKNPVLRARNGDWIAGGSVEVTLPNGTGRWDAFVDIAPSSPSSPADRPYTLTVPIPLPADRGTPGSSFPGEGVIQPTLWESPSPSEPGHIHMLLRSSTGRIVRSDSADGGRTWSEARLTEMPNNNSGICVGHFGGGGQAKGDGDGDGRLVLACNPVGPNWGPRTPLVCLLSTDDGTTWAPYVTLEDKPAPQGFGGIVALETGIVNTNNGESEFSYPTVAPTSAEDEPGVWVSYTWQRRGIVLAKITEKGHHE